jgi:hypothetical protein
MYRRHKLVNLFRCLHSFCLHPTLLILSRVLVSKKWVRIGNRFIGSSLVVTSLNYYTIAALRNAQSPHEFVYSAL